MIATLPLDPIGVFCWLSTGAVAGWLVDAVIKGRSLLADALIGMAGAVVSGYLFGLMKGDAIAFLGSILVAFVGACLLIAMFRLVAPRRQLRSG